MNADEAKADSLALIAFAKAVHVTVENISNSSIFEDSNGIERTYNSSVTVISNFDASGLKKYSERHGRIYVVYYYINKREYVENCLNRYNTNIQLAESYENSDRAHAKNLVLGYYYLAYEAAATSLFSVFYPAAEILKIHTLDLIKDRYESMGYFLSARNVGATRPSKVILVRDENSKTLPGFDYLSFNNEWVAPKYFCDNNAEPCTDISKAKWAYVDNTNKEFRFRYEVLINNKLVKIHVPEKFYYLRDADGKHFF